MQPHIKKPTIVKSEDNMPKLIREFIGRVNTGTEALSIARMSPPAGWEEPAQTPEFIVACLPAFSADTVHREGA